MGEVVIDFKNWMRDRLWCYSDSDLLSLDEKELLDSFLEDLRAEFIKRDVIRETIGLIRQEQEA